MSIVDDIVFANNGLDARLIYEGRKFYKDKDWFGNGRYLIVDLWEHLRYYGKVNRTNVPVMLNEENLKPLVGGKEGLLTLDFVSDAFTDMKKYFDRAKAQKKIAGKDTKIGKLEPVAAWQANMPIHHDIVNAVYDIFVLTYLNDFARHSKIKDYRGFLREFIKFYYQFRADLPLTRTGYLKSSYNPILSSGMAIEVFKGDYSDDRRKVDFIQDKNFVFYKTMASRFGFMVDKNGPWRLVFDVAQPRAQKYMHEYGITYEPGSASDLFEQYYRTSHSEDIDVLSEYIRHMFRTYAVAYPFVCNKARELIYDISENEKLMLYAKIRLIEENKSPYDIPHSIKRILTSHKFLDKSSFMLYLNKEIGQQ